MAEFEWPWQYSFPPFFTLQPHTDTRAKQIAAWKNLVLEYIRAKNLSVIDILEAESMPLFKNAMIDRKLRLDDVLLILEELMKSGYATPLDKYQQRWLVYWHTLEEWADIINTWAQETGRLNQVFTLYELTDGTDTTKEEFYGLDSEVLLRALKILVRADKAQLIADEGVKFY